MSTSDRPPSSLAEAANESFPEAEHQLRDPTVSQLPVPATSDAITSTSDQRLSSLNGDDSVCPNTSRQLRSQATLTKTPVPHIELTFMSTSDQRQGSLVEEANEAY
jgi:hypothetical protein